MHRQIQHFSAHFGPTAFSAALLACFVGLIPHANRSTAADPIVDDTEAARNAAAAFRVPKEFTVEVFAAKPQLFNPVAICLDEQGRVYVAEEHRFKAGTPENRTHNFMLNDDLQVNTLADRLAMQRKWAKKFENGSDWFTQQSDIVRRLEDRNGDGRADRSVVFADGFDGPLDGLGSGLIARDGKVWYTCIPSLWLLSDDNSNGQADTKTSLLNGFGVNAAFYGHDLHGLVWGTDGRLYFSVGDRGAHVVTKEGTTIANPRNGAVFRCNPDGTELELIHRGLRNPQELAFDQFGNLFADDNNCDKGDHSRLVYIVPSGDSGWNMAFQTIEKPYLTGPWHAEGMWHLSHELQPAYIVPPIGKLGAGPSGFVFSSGTSLPPRFENHFFYCNYTGNGGVESFAVRPDGAGFQIVDHQDFCKPVFASDIDFGYDGKMYIADYAGNPWDRSTTGGRVYTLFDKSRLDAVKQTRKLFQQGFKKLKTDKLVDLLHHADMRVRLRAQFELVDRNRADELLTEIAHADENQLARLHAIWGLGQIGRQRPQILQGVFDALDDNDAEVRAQTAKVLGDAHYRAAAVHLLPLLSDSSSRVRFFSAIALGELQHEAAMPALFEMLRANDGKDRYLVHAGVVALEKLGDRDAVQEYAKDKSMAIRMAVLLVQRRWQDARISQFLDDADVKLVTEAARAINDLPMVSGREALAQLAIRYRNTSGDHVVPLMRRIINTNYQLGHQENIESVINIAASSQQTDVVRAEALSALAAWAGPSNRDRVTGFWRPVPTRSAAPVRAAVQQAASKLLSATSGKLQTQVTELLTALDVKTDDDAFALWVTDKNRSVNARIAAIRLLSNRRYSDLPRILDVALDSDQPRLRAEARDLVASRDTSRATAIFSQLLDSQQATLQEKQRAFAALAQLETDGAAALLDAWAARLRQQEVPGELLLDLLEALKASPSPSRTAAVTSFQSTADKSDPLSRYRSALTGGDAENGRELFNSHQLAQCIRCHSVEGDQKKAGPNLAKVASPERKHDRRSLLESIVAPNARIAKGYGTVTLVLQSGKVVAGTIQAEDKQTITLLTPQNATLRFAQDMIDERTATTSAMPPMAKVLSLREIRDLVEFLAKLK